MNDCTQMEQIQEDMTNMLAMAQDQITEARQFLQDASSAYANVEMESSRLDQAMYRLETFVDDFRQDNIDLRPEVERAAEHARQLQREAQGLEE